MPRLLSYEPAPKQQAHLCTVQCLRCGRVYQVRAQPSNVRRRQRPWSGCRRCTRGAVRLDVEVVAAVERACADFDRRPLRVRALENRGSHMPVDVADARP